MIAGRLVLATATALVVVLLTGVPSATAGGSTFDFDAPTYEPGEQAFAWASVSWDHYDFLGRPEDGPYRAYLLPFDPDTSYDRAWNDIPADATYVADLDIHEETYEQDGMRYGPHHATVTFTVPDLPPGEYELLHCNDPCTEQLGDITGGMLTIRRGGPAATTTTAAPSTTAAPTTTAPELAFEPLVADEPRSDGTGPLLAVGVVVVGVGLGVAGWRLLRRGQPTPKPT